MLSASGFPVPFSIRESVEAETDVLVGDIAQTKTELFTPAPDGASQFLRVHKAAG